MLFECDAVKMNRRILQMEWNVPCPTCTHVVLEGSNVTHQIFASNDLGCRPRDSKRSSPNGATPDEPYTLGLDCKTLTLSLGWRVS